MTIIDLLTYACIFCAGVWLGFSVVESKILKKAEKEQKTEVRELLRLEETHLNILIKKLSPPVVTSTTTELQAGYQLGIQYTLSVLREGFTVIR